MVQSEVNAKRQKTACLNGDCNKQQSLLSSIIPNFDMRRVLGTGTAEAAMNEIKFKNEVRQEVRRQIQRETERAADEIRK